MTILVCIIDNDLNQLLLTQEALSSRDTRTTLSDSNGEVLSVIGPAGAIPGFTVQGRARALWIGNQAATLVDNVPGAFEARYDILAVSRWGDGWAVIDELSVTLLTDDGLETSARYEHDEVIMSWSLTSGTLQVTDFRGLVLQLDANLEVAE